MSKREEEMSLKEHTASLEEKMKERRLVKCRKCENFFFGSLAEGFHCDGCGDFTPPSDFK